MFSTCDCHFFEFTLLIVTRSISLPESSNLVSSNSYLSGNQMTVNLSHLHSNVHENVHLISNSGSTTKESLPKICNKYQVSNHYSFSGIELGLYRNIPSNSCGLTRKSVNQQPVSTTSCSLAISKRLLKRMNTTTGHIHVQPQNPPYCWKCTLNFGATQVCMQYRSQPT